ncbi:MAG: DNA recombination protein RmuC [Thioalkalivibrio sp.]
MDTILIIAALIALAIGALLGYGIASLRAQRQVAVLESELAAEQRRGEERAAAFEESRKQMGDSFSTLAGQALRHNSEEFLRLAQEHLKSFQVQASADLTQKEKAIEGLVKPIRETLEKTEAQIRAMEQSREAAFGSLSQHLKLMAEGQQRLQSETHNLVRALSRPTVRGQWGEMTLKRLAELAGMVEHCDFQEQNHRATEDGAMRPDMIVRMPDARELVVDAKTPLDAYLAAVDAPDDKLREQHLKTHARKVRERMKELASKAYWTQFKESPDFVILFIPGDQFLSAALEHDPNLLEDALSNRVILATPSSLVALLRAVAYGWRQQAVAENAEKIRELGEELYKRLATFTEHLTRVGRTLGTSVDHYNKAVGSLERSVMPGARRFAELGIQVRKHMEEPTPLEQSPRLPMEGEPEQDKD